LRDGVTDLGVSLIDFRGWSVSDLVSNATLVISLNTWWRGLKDSTLRFDESSAGCKRVANAPAAEPRLPRNSDSPEDRNSLMD